MSGTASASLAPSVVAAEQRAREFLEQAQWRRARDELKPLVKIDRPRFLPLLIKANLGLSREMMAKGQVAEAQQVLAYLAGIATSEQLRAAELELSGQPGGASGTADDLAHKLADPNSRLSEQEKLRLADELVLTFQNLEGQEAPGAGVAAELRAVQEGLLAISLQQWDRLAEVLRFVPHRSPLAHWSAFLKGLAAFHTGDLAKAQRFFGNLPAHTVPAKASQGYLLWLQGPVLALPKGQPSEIVLEGVCRLLGQPGVGRGLLHADQLWKQGRHAESYRAFRDTVREFPVQNLTWLGTITDFFFNAVHVLSDVDRERYVQTFDDLLLSGAKNGVEEMLCYRLFALGDNERRDWEGFLRLHERLYGANPRLASLVYERLGKSLAELESDPYDFGKPQPVDGPGAVACLRKAITLDPNNLEAALALVSIYTTLRQNRDRNRLLDQLVERFPDEKRVLVDAALGCIDREAYVKGLDYLERARRLDQLDPRIPDLIVEARRRLASQYSRQKRLDKARECLAAIEPFLTDRLDDFQRSRWTARLRQGVLEQLHGDPDRGQKLMEEARAVSPSPAAFLLFAHLSVRSRALETEATTPFWQELREALRSAPRLGQLVLLVRILDHWQGSAPTAKTMEIDRLLRKNVQAACQHAFTREEARQLVELRVSEPSWRHDLNTVIKKVLGWDSLDPLFRLYKLQLNKGLTTRSDRVRKELDTLLHEAGRRGDETTIQRLRHLIKRLESPPPPPFPLPPFGLPDFDEPEEDLPDWAHLPPGIAHDLAPLLDILSRMSDSELQHARRTRPRGMPAEIFDTLAAMAKNKTKPPANQPPKPRADQRSSTSHPPSPGPRAEEPNQLDLL